MFQCFSCIFADVATTLNCIVVVLFKRAECCNKKLHVDLLLCVTMQFVNLFCHRLLAQTMSCKRHLIKMLNIGKEIFDCPTFLFIQNALCRPLRARMPAQARCEDDELSDNRELSLFYQ